MTLHQSVATLLAASALIAVVPCAHAEESLGRLFFTPERRELLDRQRILNTLETQAVNEDPQLIVNGQVRRSSGKHTTWVNGLSQNEEESRTGVVTRPDARSPGSVVIESGDTPKTAIRIGETLNRGTNETRDLIGDGEIVIRRNDAVRSR